MKIGFENRSFENCPDERSLKRANRRSSERHIPCPELKFNRVSVQNWNFRHFASLKRVARRLSEQRKLFAQNFENSHSLKQTVSEL